jgi:uncharacterized OB-fold protein
MATSSRADAAELTEEFWAAAAAGRLVRPVCPSCGRSFFTPRVACPHCLQTGWTYEQSSGSGVVVSHTTVYRGPDLSWPVPYVLAVVSMDEGWTMLSRLLVEPPDDETAGALIGQRVAVRFFDAHPPDHRRLPGFELTTQRENRELPS